MENLSKALGKVTALGRPIDPNYPTNKAIFVLCLAAFVIAAGIGMLSELSLMEAIGQGVHLAGVLFFGWALCREIAPDDEYVAFLAAVLAGIGAVWWGPPSFLLLFWALLVLRLVNRTTGLPSRPLDMLAVLGLAGWLSWQGYLEVGLATACAFWLDASLAQPLRRHRYAALLMLAVTLASMLAGRMLPFSPPSTRMMVAGALLPVVSWLTSKPHLRSLGDVSGARLDAGRVRFADVLLATTASVSLVWHGWDGLLALAPLWAAFVAAALQRIAERMGIVGN